MSGIRRRRLKVPRKVLLLKLQVIKKLTIGGHLAVHLTGTLQDRSGIQRMNGNDRKEEER